MLIALNVYIYWPLKPMKMIAHEKNGWTHIVCQTCVKKEGMLQFKEFRTRN